MGQSATALLSLATASTTHFPEYDKGTFLTQSAAEALSTACMLVALLMFGFGVFWMIYGIYGILDAAVRKETKWTPAYYSTIFPAGTMNSALTLFSISLDSPAFRVLSTILLIVLVLNVIVNLGFTANAIARREVLIVKEDPRHKKKS